MRSACSAAAATTSGTPYPRHVTIAPPDDASMTRSPSEVTSQTPSPRSTFGYGRSRNRGKTLVRSDVIVPLTSWLSESARRALAGGVGAFFELRHIAVEVLEQLQGVPPARVRKPFGLLQERIGVDTVAVQFMAVDADPLVPDVRGHLGVELQSERPARDERLQSSVGRSDDRRAGWLGERVEVPLEPRPFRNELRVLAPHGQPADLGHLAPVVVSSEDASEQLSAEAQTQDRYVIVDCSAHQRRLADDERLRVVEGCVLRSERDDEVVVGRVDLAVVEVDTEDLDLGVV